VALALGDARPRRNALHLTETLREALNVIDPHDMACQELVEVLTDYLDGTLPEHDRARLEAHLTVCDDCQAYLEQFELAITLVDRAGEPELTLELRKNLLRAFRTHDFRT
jgi:anti-sigma factor RsiW